MSPRPRQNSDMEILQAAFRAIRRFGPQKLTLADVAREASVSPAALVQRFGSKRTLLLAAAADAADGAGYFFEGLRANHRSPKAALLGLADCMAVMGETPEEIAHTLAFLQAELTDAEFRQHAVRRSRGFCVGIRTLIEDAIEVGELRRCDTTRLARALQATLNGSVGEWTVHRKGTVGSWIRRDLRVILTPYVR